MSMRIERREGGMGGWGRMSKRELCLGARTAGSKLALLFAHFGTLASYFLSLNLNFLIWKTGIAIVPSSKVNDQD